MNERDFQELKINPILRKRLAKEMALRCFRNTHLENLHSGEVPESKTGNFSDIFVRTPDGDIPWTKVSRLSNAEMKVLMIDVVDSCYRFLTDLLSGMRGHELIRSLKEADPVPKWQTPQDGPRSVHILRITLQGIDPPIWRELLIPSDATLGQLHGAIQAVFPWTNSHLHDFHVGKMRFSDPHPEDEDQAEDERRFTLSVVAPSKGSRLFYLYDAGDDWRHEITVADVLPLRADEPIPKVQCLAGERGAPPDDCGGPGGYAELLASLRDPKTADDRERVRWLEKARAAPADTDKRFAAPFNPEAFSPAAANRALARLARHGLPMPETR